MKIKEEKLENLKKQIAGAFKDNSWERQLQIDELTKELKRVQEESELIKFKLKDSCDNCESMHQKLEERTLNLREKDNLVNELVNLMKKFQNQLNFNEELIKIVNSNKTLNESLSKLSFGLKQAPTNSIKVKK
ncbi:J domain-containing -like protein [Brachionus plicatilis]|uniref:J domain-containing-like protein n=1 Tax=Brachionus plicatilis TaxID=10195 RepID=A0A3M7PB06_BRAPC|nr:J domain-containing -like protein [Brachionus plicatilis]